jgi:hypothetical protein
MPSSKILKFKIAWLFIFLALGNMLAGCSAVGFTAGAILDEATNAKAKVDPSRVGSLKYGKDVTVFLRDSTLVSGDYYGLYDVDKQSYSQKYMSAISDSITDIFLPAINDTITVMTGKKAYRDQCFTGFGYKYQKSAKKEVSRRIPGYFYIGANSSNSSEEKIYYLNNISEIINSEGKSTRSYAIGELMKSGRIPIATGARILTISNVEQIPLEDIDHLEYRKKNAKWVLFGLGLAVDVVMVIALLSVDFSGLEMQWEF